MKKFFTIIGIIFSGLILLGILLFAYGSYFGPDLDKESKEFAENIIPKICSSWSAVELYQNADQELKKAVEKGKIITFFDNCKNKLGYYKKCTKIEGEARIGLSPAGKMITANYIANVDFDNGNAIIKIGLIKRDEKWQILAFFVESEKLFE